MQRRTFLSAAGLSILGRRALLGAPGRSDSSLSTPLCDALGIRLPIVQSGMGRVAGPELAAAVSNSGGLGILAGLGVPADDLRAEIRRMRELTDRPFGVNLWLHEQLQPPIDPATLPREQISAVQATLNTFRERLGLAPRTDPPAPLPDTIDEAFEVILEERVPVWSIGLGDPGAERVERCHRLGIRVMAMVATLADARQVEASGVDLIVAQGGEAGGHRSTWVKSANRERANIGTLALMPQIVDAVSVPVIAAGGIVDGRGLVAALALGASGILMGTRFVATRESQAPPLWKEAIRSGDSDDTTVTDVYTGLWMRALRNRFSDEYEASGTPVLPGLLQANAAGDIYAAAAARSDPSHFPLAAGQSAGLIADLPGAADVVAAVAEEALDVLDALRIGRGAE